jgi:cardiolipin synthase
LADALDRVMSDGRDTFREALAEALCWAAERMDQVSFAVTGASWLGGGIPSVERTLSELVASARREILLTAYFVTPGSERIWNELERALATGIRATVIVDRLARQGREARALFERLTRSYPATLSLYDFATDDDVSGLHAKLLIVDRQWALVGSANLSHRGMVTAHEMVVVIHGPTAESIASCVDALIRSPDTVRVGHLMSP